MIILPAITDLPIKTERGWEYYTQNSTTTTPATYTYPGNVTNYIFKNDGAGSATLTINGVATTVAAGDCAIGSAMSSFTIAAVSGTVSWTMRAFEIIPYSMSQGGVDTTQAYKQATLQNAATATGVGSYIEVSGYAGLQMEITISGIATITTQYSNDLTNWYSLNNTKGNSTASSNTQVFFNTVACRYVRANITAYTSGTVTVIATATQGVPTFGQQYSTYGNLDGSILTSTNMPTIANVGLLYNNSTWDRARNNLVGTGLGSLARTATTTSSDFTNYNHRGIILSLNVTVASGTGGLQVQIQAKDTIASAYKAINTAPTAITATGQYIYMIYPGIDTVSNNNAQNVSQVLPQIFRISVTHGDASSYSYSVNYHMIL